VSDGLGMRKVIHFAALVALALAGCTKVNQGTEVTSPTSSIQQRTYCLGRLLVDMPEDFEQTLGSDVELTYGLDKNFRRTKVELLRTKGSMPSFEVLVAKRISELTREENSDAPSKNMLSSSKRSNANSVVIRAYTSAGRLNSFNIQLIREIGTSIARFQDSAYREDDPNAIEANLIGVGARTTALTNPIGGLAKGACFGPLLIDAGQDGESFTVAFKTPRMPDVSISFDINSLVATSDGGLFKRLEKKSGLLAQAGMGPNSYRKRKVMFGERPAEEVFRTGKERDHVTRQFIAEVVMDKPATFAAPMIAINLSMGGQVGPEDYRDASMSEAEASAMWDAILKSIRLRPGAL
jgi:Tle cognate immunity protein 4 C-terminal domain/Tle cognate immunity protein 4 N-terminal domain